jgi:hypothetical protein
MSIINKIDAFLNEESEKDKLIRLAKDAGDDEYAEDVKNGKVPQSGYKKRIAYYTCGPGKLKK